VSDLPPGWTDDTTVRLPEGVSVDEVTDFVLGLLGQVPTEEELDGKLSSAFGLSHEDADLVRDRVCGGIVRAATGNPQNRPSKEKDPFAWTSFGKATADPRIITTVYPQFAPPLGRLATPKPPAAASRRLRWPPWRRR
jgi:hypothetical protein